MKHYLTKDLQFVKEGFTDLFILAAADFSGGFNAANITLTALVKGDAVLGALIDVKTVVAGPTGAPTLQVKTGTGAVAITPTCACKTATGAVTDNTIVGATISTAAENLLLVTAAGGGDSAAATAGEIWVWVKISRADRFAISA